MLPSLLDVPSDDVNKEKAIDANHKIIEAVNDQKIIDASSTVAADASSKHGEENCHIAKDPFLNLYLHLSFVDKHSFRIVEHNLLL